MRRLADALFPLFARAERNRTSTSDLPPEPQPLAPYTHRLNPEGTACAEDCEACRWVERTQDAPWNKKAVS
jgi:hypothetical protein